MVTSEWVQILAVEADHLQSVLPTGMTQLIKMVQQLLGVVMVEMAIRLLVPQGQVVLVKFPVAVAEAQLDIQAVVRQQAEMAVMDKL